MPCAVILLGGMGSYPFKCHLYSHSFSDMCIAILLVPCAVVVLEQAVRSNPFQCHVQSSMCSHPFECHVQSSFLVPCTIISLSVMRCHSF